MDIERTLSALRNQTELDNLDEINILRICLSKYHKDINFQCDICKDTEFPNFGMFMDHCYKEHRILLHLKSNNWGLMTLYRYDNKIGSVNNEFYKNRLCKAFVYFSNDFELRFKCNMCDDHDFFSFEEVLIHFHKAHPLSFDFESELVYMILNIKDDKKYKRESKRISNFPKDVRSRRLTPPRSIENKEHIERRLSNHIRDDAFYDKTRFESVRRPNKFSFDIQQHLVNKDLPIMENRNNELNRNVYQSEGRPARYRSPVERSLKEQPFLGGRNVSLQLNEKMYAGGRIDNSFLRSQNPNTVAFGRSPNNRNELFSLGREYPPVVRGPNSSLLSQNAPDLNFGNTKFLMERELSQRNRHLSLRENLTNPSLPKIMEHCPGSTIKTFTNNLAGLNVVKQDHNNSFSNYLGKNRRPYTSTIDNTSNGSKYKTSLSNAFSREFGFSRENNLKSYENIQANKRVKINNITRPNLYQAEVSVQNQLKNFLNENVGTRLNLPFKKTETITLSDKITEENVAVIRNEKGTKPKLPFPEQLNIDESERMFPEENDVLTVIEMKFINSNFRFFKCIICEEQAQRFAQIIHHVKVAHRKLLGPGRQDIIKFYLYSEDISNSKLNYEAKIELRDKVFDMRATKKAELRQEHNLDHVKLPKIIQFTGDWIELAVLNFYTNKSKCVFICDICLEVGMKPLRKYLRHLYDCHLSCLSHEIMPGGRSKTGNLILAINNVTKYPLTVRTVKRQMSRRRRRQWRRKQTRLSKLKPLNANRGELQSEEDFNDF